MKNVEYMRMMKIDRREDAGALLLRRALLGDLEGLQVDALLELAPRAPAEARAPRSSRCRQDVVHGALELVHGDEVRDGRRVVLDAAPSRAGRVEDQVAVDLLGEDLLAQGLLGGVEAARDRRAAASTQCGAAGRGPAPCVLLGLRCRRAPTASGCVEPARSGRRRRGGARRRSCADETIWMPM